MFIHLHWPIKLACYVLADADSVLAGYGDLREELNTLKSCIKDVFTAAQPTLSALQASLGALAAVDLDSEKQELIDEWDLATSWWRQQPALIAAGAVSNSQAGHLTRSKAVSSEVGIMKLLGTQLISC